MSNKAYYFGDANAIARLMKKMYFGVETEVPIYEEHEVTTTKQLSAANLGDFFTVTNGAGNAGWTVSDVSTGKIKLNPNNIGVNNSTATITLKATHAFTMVRFDGTSWVTEENYDKLSVILYKSNGALEVRYANEVSGRSGFGSGYGKSMESGGYITLTYVKDSSGHATNESVTVVIECQDSITITTTEQVQVGTENKGLARKVIRAYQPDANGKAQLWFDADAAGTSVTFSGTHTISDVTIDGKAYKLMTMTGSGTLTVKGGKVQYWMCGGGAGGGADTSDKCCGGGGGYVSSGEIATGTYVVTIGAGGAAEANGNATTATGDNTYTANGASGANGGSGGGGGSVAGTGAGVSTYPFGITDLLAHCAGGGGGCAYSKSTKYTTGAKGGTNGGNGSVSNTTGSTSDIYDFGGAGGEYGGGGGAKSNGSNSTNASFYGGGGGGHGQQGTVKYRGATAGYQGVAYVLVPVA